MLKGLMVESTPANSSSEEELWLVCPICKEPNPAGTPHCQFCWGAALYSVKPITNQELAEVTRRKLARARRLALYHHEPANSDAAIERIFRETLRFEELTRQGPELEVIAAYDGLEIDL